MNILYHVEYESIQPLNTVLCGCHTWDRVTDWLTDWQFCYLLYKFIRLWNTCCWLHIYQQTRGFFMHPKWRWRGQGVPEAFEVVIVSNGSFVKGYPPRNGFNYVKNVGVLMLPKWVCGGHVHRILHLCKLWLLTKPVSEQSWSTKYQCKWVLHDFSQQV